MATLHIDIDEQTLERLQLIAKARNRSVDAVVREILAQHSEHRTSDPWLGAFSEDADLLDQIVESALDARERDALRRTGA